MPFLSHRLRLSLYCYVIYLLFWFCWGFTVWAFPSCSERGLHWSSGAGLLTDLTPLAAEHGRRSTGAGAVTRAQEHGRRSCDAGAGAWAQEL